MNFLKYKNLYIEYPGFVNLESSEIIDKYNNVCNTLDFVFENLKTKLKTIEISTDKAIFAMLKSKEKIAIFIGLDNLYNPYLFMYDLTKHQISNHIYAEKFYTLSSDFMVGELEKKTRDIIKLNNIIDKEIILGMRKLANIHDDYVIRSAEKFEPILARINAVYIDTKEESLPIRDYHSGKIIDYDER